MKYSKELSEVNSPIKIKVSSHVSDDKVNRKCFLSNNYSSPLSKNFFTMQLKSLFKSPDSDEYGQFVQLDPHPTNKHICDAKRLLRDAIELHEQNLGKTHQHIRWIVKECTQDDQNNDIGIVGYRCVFS